MGMFLLSNTFSRNKTEVGVPLANNKALLVLCKKHQLT